VDATAKRLLSLSFTLSAVLAMIAIHGTAGQYSVAPPTLDTANAPRLLPIPVALPVLQVLVGIIAVAYLVCLVAVSRRLRRTGSFTDRLPAWMLVATQALWYVVPVLTLQHPEQLLPFAAVWVSTAHSAQYLWITTYYAKRSAAHEHSGRFLLKALIAGGGVTVLPGLLFAPGVLGALSWDGGLALLIFSVVNLHHFILDGAIWKLRDQSIAGVLLRRAAPPSEASAVAEAPRRSALGRLVWGSALVSLAVPLVGVHETVVINESQSNERIDLAAQRLRWIGREPAWLDEFAAGRASELELLDDDAIAHYRQSIELRPTATAWSALGRVYNRRQDSTAALAAYRKATLVPGAPASAWLWCARLELALAEAGDDPGPRLERAREYLDRALSLDPDPEQATTLLAQVDAARKGYLRGAERPVTATDRE
jgi:cytochrome c-type biogenesis protein CcmH/NrfG